MKILKLLAKFLVCYIALIATAVGVYFLCTLLPPSNNGEIIYQLVICALVYMIPALLALGYSLLVFAVLKNSPKRFLIALLNGVVMTALSIGAILLINEVEPDTLPLLVINILRWLVPIVPSICVLSIIMPPVLLKLRPKNLPQVETVPEAAPVPQEAPKEAEESK